MVRSPIWSPDIVLSNRNFLPPVVQHLPKALLLALLVGAPLMAKQAEWEKYRDQLLGPMRVKLMESCALGNKFNAAKLSYWEPKSSQRLQNYVLSQGETLKKFLAYTSGEAAAMKTVCPNVW